MSWSSCAPTSLESVPTTLPRCPRDRPSRRPEDTSRPDYTCRERTNSRCAHARAHTGPCEGLQEQHRTEFGSEVVKQWRTWKLDSTGYIKERQSGTRRHRWEATRQVRENKEQVREKGWYNRMNLNITLSKHIFCPLPQLKPVSHQVLLAPCLYHQCSAILLHSKLWC